MKIHLFISIWLFLLKCLHGQDCKSTFRQAALKSHNSLRSIHGSASLAESSQLTTSAQSYADYMAVNDLFKNSGESPGENLFMVAGVTIKNCSSKMTINLFD